MANAPTVIEFAGYLPPGRALGDYAAVAAYRVGGEQLLVTVSITLAAIVETRAVSPINWLNYPPLAALGYDRIEDMVQRGQSATEIPLTAEDADELLLFHRAWQANP